MALEVAAEGLGQASPNPLVGTVLVRDGRVVGKGAHFYAERKHAEIVALEEAGELARGATAYVNLEPCSHFGRTPPCCDALVVCHDAPHCLCAWECILATDHEPAMCSEQCEEDSSALTDLLACEQDACHQHCAAATDTGTSGA